MNYLLGQISGIDRAGSIALVDVNYGNLSLCASIMGDAGALGKWQCGQTVQLGFHEMEVAIAKNWSGQISLRNRLPGVIVELEFGEILTRVWFCLLQDDTRVSAVITTRSARHLQLQCGDQIEGLVKSNEIDLSLIDTEGNK